MKNSSINHLAIIMDGNGRWANQKNQQRVFGHEKGAQTAKKTVSYTHLTLPTKRIV